MSLWCCLLSAKIPTQDRSVFALVLVCRVEQKRIDVIRGTVVGVEGGVVFCGVSPTAHEIQWTACLSDFDQYKPGSPWGPIQPEIQWKLLA